MLQEHCIPQQDIATTLALQQYAPISLSKMGRVALLNRTDTKYVLSLATLQRIMPQLTEVYAALVVQGKRASHYRTLYFDSADFGLYHRHHAGMLDRYKVRAPRICGFAPGVPGGEAQNQQGSHHQKPDADAGTD
jgi:hypothetical protein